MKDRMTENETVKGRCEEEEEKGREEAEKEESEKREMGSLGSVVVRCHCGSQSKSKCLLSCFYSLESIRERERERVVCVCV